MVCEAMGYAMPAEMVAVLSCALLWGGGKGRWFEPWRRACAHIVCQGERADGNIRGARTSAGVGPCVGWLSASWPHDRGDSRREVEVEQIRCLVFGRFAGFCRVHWNFLLSARSWLGTSGALALTRAICVGRN